MEVRKKQNKQWNLATAGAGDHGRFDVPVSVEIMIKASIESNKNLKT